MRPQALPKMRACRYCATTFPIVTRADANRQYCSRKCSRKGIGKSTLAFHEANPDIMKSYNKARVAKNPGAWREKHQEERAKIIAALGGKCIVCGVTNICWLETDYAPTTRGKPFRHPRHPAFVLANLGDFRLLCANHSSRTDYHRGNPRDGDRAMARPLALDLFCGAGGSAMGLHRAGFDVTGIDHRKQPRYPFRFIQADALNPPVDLSRFDLIWASPPCQAHVSLRWMHNAKHHEALIEPTRALLQSSGRLWVIENVPGAPLRHEMELCGTMFGLGVGDAELWRHRKFETSWAQPLFTVPPCRHRARARVIGVYGGHGRDRRRGKRLHKDVQDFPATARREAMGIDWMGEEALSQAIPPAYSEFIGHWALRSLQEDAA